MDGETERDVKEGEEKKRRRGRSRDLSACLLVDGFLSGFLRDIHGLLDIELDA